MSLNNLRNNRNKREKSIVDIIQIIFRRKLVLLLSVFVFIAGAVLYNYLTTPVYQATVLLKKETAQKEAARTDISEIIKVQTRDEIETEMELVKTWSVLSKVVDQLKLNINLKSIITPSDETFEIEESIINVEDPSFLSKHSLPFPPPDFQYINLKKKKNSGEFRVRKVGTNSFEIYDAVRGNLIQVAKTEANPIIQSTENIYSEFEVKPDSNAVVSDSENAVKFNLPIADVKISWTDAPVGSEFVFGITNFYEALKQLSSQVSVERKVKTNVFTVSVKSISPYAAAKIANTIVDKFRESRMDQKKQTIRYSFKFVDEQLKKMREKLSEAEDNLSRFKASGQITTIDQSSTELIQFLSRLEVEKFNTDLLLTDYKNKVAEIQDKMKTNNYIDQSYLSPERTNDINSPFSALLKQLSDLELQRLELLQRRTLNHPDVKALDDQIQMAKEKLASYNQNTLTAYQIIISSLEKKLLKINNLMSKYEVKLEMLPAKENKLARLMRQKNVYEKINNLLLDKREEMRMAELSKLQDIAVVDPAFEPLKPVSPKKMFNLIIAVILGGFVGLLGVFVFELKDNKLINLDELEEEFNLPIFAIIPSYTNEIKDKIKNAKESRDKFVMLMDEQEGFKETYRLLKTKLLFQMEGREKIFMITSCEENTGKTSIVANLAISIAQEGRKVLVVDCDLRKAELSKTFDIPKNAPGLIEFIEKDVAPTIYTKILKNIDVLPAGGTREDSSHLLNSERMKLLFNAIDTSTYDYIIIDTPPVTRVVDTLILGRSIKDAILIVRPGHSFKEAVIGGIQEMLQAKIKIRGIVANAAEIRDSYYYRYRYGYGYGYSYGGKNGKDKKSSKKKTAELTTS